MSTQASAPKAPEPTARVEPGVPRALVYMIVPALLFLVWAMFFKS